LSEIEKTSVNEEVATPPQSQSIEPEAYNPDSSQEEKSSQEYNWKQMRESKDRLEREKEELLRKVQEMEAQSQQKRDTSVYEETLDPDDLVEWKHVQSIKQELESLKKQNYLQKVEADLIKENPDILSVVTKENIRKLQEAEPKVSAGLLEIKDEKSQALAVYEYLKAKGYAVSENFESEKERAAKNAQKPGSLGSVGKEFSESPISQAHMFSGPMSEKRKQELYRQSREAVLRGNR
jgi:hypothetical protein